MLLLDISLKTTKSLRTYAVSGIKLKTSHKVAIQYIFFSYFPARDLINFKDLTLGSFGFHLTIIIFNFWNHSGNKQIYFSNLKYSFQRS